MKYPICILLLIASLPLFTALGQRPTTSPTREPTTNPKPAEAPGQEDEVVRITTNLVQVDAVVTDKNGKLVGDLKREELQISEDGKPQAITNFSFYLAPAIPPSAAARTRDADPGNVPAPTLRLRPDQVRRTIALVIDDLGLSFESTYKVRRALRKFIDEQMQPGDLVAIIRTAGGMGALQQFTSDKRQLAAAIERVKWYPSGRVAAFGIQPTNPVGGQAPSKADPIGEFHEDLDQFRDDVMSVGTLGAVQYVVKGLKELPGRKSILLISDGISLFSPSSTNRDNARSEPPRSNNRVMDALHGLVEQANRASVVIYTMHASGLECLCVPNLQTSSDGDIRDQAGDERAAFFESQNGLNYLAQETGGIAIRNNNDLSNGVKRILEDQRGYYLIGYRPDESTFDSRGRRQFHHLSLKVLRPGKFDVRMRNGFTGVPDSEAHPTAPTPAEQLVGALSSPFGSAGVRLRLTTLFANDAKRGTIMRSLLHINAADLTFTDEPEGWHKATFDILAVTFGDNGVVVDQLSHKHVMRVHGAEYERVLQRGFVYFVTVPVKKPGAYQLRTALRDEDSSRVGSVSQFIEVPDLKKNRLSVSGILLTKIDPSELKNLNVGSAGVAASIEGQQIPETDPTSSAALREFRPGQTLSYGFFVYNARMDKATLRPELFTQIKLFRDGVLTYTGRETPFDMADQVDMKRLTGGGVVQLGSAMVPGEYVLQVNIIDRLANSKYRVAPQWIDFEILK
jgi:VWFA-related protein